MPGVTPGSRVDINSSKWGGGAHYCLVATILGEDEHGVWTAAPLGNTITRGDTTFRTKEPTVACIPRAGMWWATWWLGHPDVEVYVNINTVPEWRDGVVSVVDLDLDVIRWLDGRIETVDEDEFAEHQVALGYPAALIAAARTAAGERQGALVAGQAPFGGEHEPWVAAAGAIIQA